MSESRSFSLRRLLFAVGLAALGLGMTRALLVLPGMTRIPESIENRLWVLLIPTAGASLGAAIGTLRGDRIAWTAGGAMAWPLVIRICIDVRLGNLDPQEAIAIFSLILVPLGGLAGNTFRQQVCGALVGLAISGLLLLFLPAFQMPR